MKTIGELLKRVEVEYQRARDDAEQTTEQNWLDYHEGEAEALSWVCELLAKACPHAHLTWADCEKEGHSEGCFTATCEACQIELPDCEER